MRVSLWFFALALVVAAGLAGCAPHGERADGTPDDVSSPDGLRFSIRVVPLKFAHGERVTLEASLFNDSEDAYKKKFRSQCIWDYEVTTTEGVPLRAARECLPQDSTLVLAPGELRMIMREWGGRDRYFNATQPLAVGRYHVVAGFLDGDRHVIPMSVPVEIEVLAKRGAR